MEKKPYVIYELSADLDDKGVGYVLRRAIVNFMRSHGIEFQIKSFALTSNAFGASLEIYDNGSLFSIQSLLESLERCGRLPNDENKRPKINVRPLSRECAIETTQEKPTSWEKVACDIRGQSKNYEKRLGELIEDVKKRQEVINRQAKEISNLEKRTVSCSDPTQLLLQSYIPNSLESLLECAIDWNALSPIEKDMMKEGLTNSTYLDYVNRRQKGQKKEQFASESQLNEWVRLTSPEGEEEQTRKYQEIKKQLESANKDRAALSSVELTEKSDGLKKSLNQLMMATSGKITSLSEQLADLEKSMRDRGETYVCLSKYKEDYDRFSKILERIRERQKNPVKLPVIFEQNRPGAVVYVPSVSPESDLEKYISNLLRENLTTLENTKKDYLRGSIRGNDDIGQIVNRFEKSKTLRALGIRPQFSVINI